MSWKTLLQQQWREHRWLLALCATYALAAIAYAHHFGGLYLLHTASYAKGSLMVVLGTTLPLFSGHAIWRFYHHYRKLKQVLPALEQTTDGLMQRYGNPRAVTDFGMYVLMFVTMCVTQPFFKSSIIHWQPYHWDPFFYHLDRMLFAGHTPWSLLQPLLGHPPITWLLDRLYIAWFPVMFSTVAIMAVSERRILRIRYLLSFVLLWVLLGGATATIFASVGPCYYHHLWAQHVPHEYVMMQHYLTQTHATWPLISTTVKTDLWRMAYPFNVTTTQGGVSAFPSLHVGVVALNMFLYEALPYRRLRLFGRFFCVGITLASVHLGWHYAADSLAAILGAYGVWSWVGNVTKS